MSCWIWGISCELLDLGDQMHCAVLCSNVMDMNQFVIALQLSQYQDFVKSE